MSKKKTEILFDLAEQNDGYVSVASAQENGIAQTYLSLACESGLFAKVSKGLYLKRGYEHDPFYELAFRYRKCVFALRSALYLHGLSDVCTYEIHLPLNYQNKGIEGASVRHVGEKEYGVGQILAVTPHGNLVNTYSIERCMVDLLRRNQEFAKEEFVDIWLRAKKKNPYPEVLRHIAQAFHVEGELDLMNRLY